MKVLVTGGSGLIGRNLTKQLLAEGNEVVHLTRSKNSRSSVKTYEWDWKNKKIEDKCFDGITHIVHLAGAPIADKAWTMKRKHEIVNSRVETAKLLFSKVDELNIDLEAFISASAIGYYGARTVEQTFTEDDKPHDDFIAKCCILWENAADLFEPKCRVAKLRTGVVLDGNQGALPKMLGPMKWGLGSALGSGKQWMPWISIDDMVNMYLHLLKNNESGVYNAVTNNITNQDFTKEVASVMGKKLWAPNVPRFVIKGIYGELADVVLEGSKVDSSKVKSIGFKFEDEDLKLTLERLIKKR